MYRWLNHCHNGITAVCTSPDPGALASTRGTGHRADTVWTPNATTVWLFHMHAQRPGGYRVAESSRL